MYIIFIYYVLKKIFVCSRSDAGRYCILFAHGGVYSDLDYEPLANFWENVSDVAEGRVSLVESPYIDNEKFQGWCSFKMVKNKIASLCSSGSM